MLFHVISWVPDGVTGVFLNHLPAFSLEMINDETVISETIYDETNNKQGIEERLAR